MVSAIDASKTSKYFCKQSTTNSTNCQGGIYVFHHNPQQHIELVKGLPTSDVANILGQAINFQDD